MLDIDNIAMISDFGCSKLNQFEQHTKRVGTGHYMAPEVINSNEYDQSADVFSFGIIMFELLCETTQPYGEKANNIELKVCKNPLFRPVLPEHVQIAHSQMIYIKLMQECWEHDPEERPSFDQIVQILEQMLAQ